MSREEILYEDLQRAKGEVIDSIVNNSNFKTDALTRLEEACEKICFDYENELEHCQDIAAEDLESERVIP